MPSFISTNGISLHYYDDASTEPGNPDAIILLPTLPWAAHSADFAWVRACRAYRVLRLDMRGHGASQVPTPDPPLTMDR